MKKALVSLASVCILSSCQKCMECYLTDRWGTTQKTEKTCAPQAELDRQRDNLQELADKMDSATLRYEYE